jgi:hypothetical protein
MLQIVPAQTIQPNGAGGQSSASGKVLKTAQHSLLRFHHKCGNPAKFPTIS